jgi:rhodanese-related sulfurtransferase
VASEPELGPTEASARLGDFLTVDVRGEHEFHGPLGHIRGALLIPLPELEARAKELPRDRALLLVCRSGVRSAKACAQLGALGFGPTTNLAGGMMAWGHAGLTVERPRYASPAALVENALAWLAQVTAQPLAAVRERLQGALAAAAEARNAAEAGRALDWVEQVARNGGNPPDLGLSMTAFRAALGAF